MGWRQVPRDEAIALGVINPDETPDEISTDYRSRLKLDPQEFDQDFFAELKREVANMDPKAFKIEIVKDKPLREKLP